MNAMRNMATAHKCKALFPYASARVERRLEVVAETVARTVKTECLRGGGLLANTIVMPATGIVFAGTSCDRLMLRSESHFIAQMMGMDVVLLRFHPLQGVSFDVVLSQPVRDLLNYHLWTTGNGDLWLIPDGTGGPHLRLAANGITVSTKGPISCTEIRAAGVGRAVAPFALEGGE